MAYLPADMPAPQASKDDVPWWDACNHKNWSFAIAMLLSGFFNRLRQPARDALQRMWGGRKSAAGAQCLLTP